MNIAGLTDFKRVATYGEPVFCGPGPGPLWRHLCGTIAFVDLLADDEGQLQPWERDCPGCSRRDGWLPLLVYTGPLCDQCHGNGWVPISGRVLAAVCGFDTVTECTACEASGMAVIR